MSLTANFDYCVELGIAQVREIFHLAFKTEARYPHNIGPFERTLSGRTLLVSVRVHDDNDRPADLRFLDDRHILFSFPFDITVETADSPDPALSRITLRVRVEIPALLNAWPEAGEDVLGLDFTGVTAADVQIVEFAGLPAIGAENFSNAIHRTYDTIPHVYSAGGNTLVLYDGNRDTTLSPPNAATPFAIEALLETHSGLEYLKVTAPIHVSAPLPAGGVYASYGRIIFWRRVERSDTTITLVMNAEPADAALQTKVELDTPDVGADTELAQIVDAIHARYDSVPHVYTLSGNTLTIYDDSRDITLSPPNVATPFEIEAAIEFHSGIEYLKVTLPIHVNVPSVPVYGLYTSYGRIIFWRAITRTATTISVNMATEPADPARATVVELDSGPAVVADGVESALQPLAVSALGGFGTVSSASVGSAADLLQPLAVQAINSFGVITEPAFSEAAARDLLRNEIAAYINKRRYPVYSPKSGDPEHPLSTPVGFLLVADEVLAILLNRRSGTAADDHAPDNFLGSNELALAVGRAKVDEIIAEAIDAQYPNVRHGGTDEIHTPEGDATLKALSVVPADPGAHGHARGHLWVTGEAEVHIDCWPDPDVSFEGPVFINATPFTNPDGTCGLDVQGEAGDFDVDQSCCDVLIDLLIPIVGIVMLIIIESTIDEVGGELAKEVAAEQGDRIEPIPPVVNGIAEVQSCLMDIFVSSQGFVFPGDITIRRLGRSFEDLEEGGDLPRP